MSKDHTDDEGVTLTGLHVLNQLTDSSGSDPISTGGTSTVSKLNSSLVGTLLSESRRLFDAQREAFARLQSGVDDTLAPSISEIPFGGAPAPDASPVTEETLDSDEPLLPIKAIGNAPERYQDLGPLGAGGMGRVRRVKDHMLNRSLAMKTLHLHLLDKEGLVLRFIHEAQVVSQLQHPNIMPVYEIGVLDTGQLYFTMAEVKGDSLHDHILRVHRARALDYAMRNPEDWNLHRLISVFHDVCKAVAYANERGVIHRDLKPANVMIGPLGEVLVVDWGLAKVIGTPDTYSEAIVTAKTASDAELTMVGAIYGTAGYIAPELAMGDGQEPCAATEVYALGAILYEVLTGARVVAGNTAPEVIAKVVSGRLRPFDMSAAPSTEAELESEDDTNERTYVSANGAKIPRVLVEICQRALAFSPKKRYQTVHELTEVIGRWLDGSRRRETANAIVARADGLETSIRAAERRAAELETEAELFSGALKTWSDESEKTASWALEDEAKDLRLQAESLRFKQIQLWRNALAHKENLVSAHAALATRFQAMHRAAELEGDLVGAERAKIVLTEHAQALPLNYPLRDDLMRYLKGAGRLSLETSHPAARLKIAKFDTKHRRMVLGPWSDLGSSPLENHALEMGSYVIRIEAPNYHDTIYPVFNGRFADLDGKNSEGEIVPVPLLPDGTLGPDDCYVPPGWCVLGGDPNTSNSLPRQRVWIDGFVIRRFSVTNAEYLAFLNALVQQGQIDLANQHVPREQSSSEDELGKMAYAQTENGMFALMDEGDDGLWHPRQPVTLIQWRSARAYTDWLARETGLPWRLPMEFEWEKAARGVDGRFYPWGNAHDPSWSCMKDSHQGPIRMYSVDSFPVDESVYGVRGTAGNTRDWCLDRFLEDGPVLKKGRLVKPTARDLADEGFKSCRGGSYGNSASRARSADRDWWFPNRSYIGRGFRVAWGLSDWLP